MINIKKKNYSTDRKHRTRGFKRGRRIFFVKHTVRQYNKLQLSFLTFQIRAFLTELEGKKP